MDIDEDYVEDDADGSIKSIHVRNFFCHENLEVNFNKNINFIVGRNGSGKSAILTALVVGLGGRASATNRGSNLHSFIKKGANSATVEIKIKNSSPKAYKHNIYGDYITVVRNINASGGSSYKVKSATGEVVSTKFEEVNSIILAHDIQVDNPISVLNQDDARSFHASDAKKKYSLFRRATNLDQTETNYVRALENCNKASAIWNRKKEACQELEKEYKKWKISHEQLQSKDEIEAHKRELQNEYYWSEITELESEVNMVQSHYDKQNMRIEKLMEKLNKMNDNFGSNRRLIDELKNQLEVKATEKYALEQEVTDLERQVRESQHSLRGVQHSKEKQMEILKREKRKVVDLETEIQNTDSGRSASRRAELERASEEAVQAAAAAHARYDTARHHAEQARAHHAHQHAQAERAHSAAHVQRDKLRQLRQQLRELESRESNSLALYGGNMVELCNRIQQAVARGEFSAPPRGPVGAYLKVKNEKWGGAMEHIIGGSIKTFCVNSAEDSRKLFEIMDKVYGRSAKPTVACSKFLSKRHDVRRKQVRASGFTCALDALDVTDTVVANFLIDNVSLERILLVPENDDAMRLSDTVENVPENCSKIVTLDCTEYHPAPNYRSYGGVARVSQYLQTTIAERKRQLMAEVQEAEQKLRSLEAAAQSLSEEVNEAKDQERSAGRELQALVEERHRRDTAARAAQQQAQLAHAPHHALLVEELEVSKQKLQSITEQLEELSETEKQYKRQVDQYDTCMKKKKGHLGQVSTICRTLNEDIEQEQLKIDQGVTERKACEQRLKEDKSKMMEVKTHLEEKESVVQTKINQALMLCPRITNPRDKMIVTNELKKTQLKLSSIRSDGMTKAQVTEKLLEVERKYRRTRSTLDRLRTLIEDIKKTADRHLNFCQKMQTCIARKVQHCFQSILTLRGYSGRMDIDNGSGLLEVVCGGREAGAVRRAGSTSSLSGGERSYATVAFVMALWECVELPFCFLDEFDVFMDNVNRKIVMELLIDHALQNKQRQFVFLTPQDASTVTAGPDITIHVMADPRP